MSAVTRAVISPGFFSNMTTRQSTVEPMADPTSADKAIGAYVPAIAQINLKGIFSISRMSLT
jgi:hypothetical protein